MFIVMTNFGQLVYMQKPKQLSKLITNGSNKEKTKRIEQFPKNPGIEYKANTVPKNTGIPGFCKNTVPYRTGMKFLIPLGPAWSIRCHQEQSWRHPASYCCRKREI